MNENADRKTGTLRQKTAIAVLAATVLCGLFSCADTPEITAEGGRRVSGSIASLEEIELLGTEQWILMRGINREAPVMLWLAGGPGGSEIGWTRKYLSGLESHFVLVNWEQPGTGKSFGALDVKEAHVEDYVDYTIALSEYLADRFGKHKIVLAGHSWGSIIGLMAADRRPDLFSAYIGIGQQVNSIENDVMGYELVLKRAGEAGDTAVVEKLKKNGRPPYTREEKGKYAYLFQRLFHYSPSAPGIGEVDSWAMLTPEEYSLIDTVNLIRGLLSGVNYLYPQLLDLDFERDVPSLDVPAFFITGRYDYTCVQDIAYRYYRKLSAPVKRFYWFEQSGHNACYQEPEKFVKIMRDEVLPLANQD